MYYICYIYVIYYIMYYIDNTYHHDVKNTPCLLYTYLNDLTFSQTNDKGGMQVNGTAIMASTYDLDPSHFPLG